MSRIFSFLLVCFLVVGTQAQDYSDSYPINPGVDVIGYVFELEVTDVDDVIHGTTTLDVRFVEAGSRLRLDLINRSEELEGKGMVVQGVESGGVALDFAHADNAVVIDLGT